MPAPEIVLKLVKHYSEHQDSLRSPHYNEAQLRQEFLNPFFEALGWDVYNKKEFALNYREVVHEDSIHIKGSPNAKAPDYAFRLGGVRKFFVEAKKPAEDIQNTKEFAFQLKSYAWSLGLPLSILTDFEEFAVYDCRNKPSATDSPATNRILYVRFNEYPDKWDTIANIFSPDAIMRGAFDQYAENNTAKKGTIDVDDAFLVEIENWRKLLAQNIALRNTELINERRLNYAVQMTIDRIIFLRICEDRGIEPENQLYEIGNHKEVYTALIALFKRADLKYNSGLFHFNLEKGNGNRVDTFTPSLSIDDKVLKEIIRSLYYPSPYVFKEIPVEILGQVYEQFLGKVIRLTTGKQAKIEEKPEVRKAGGVYYTPKYIVDYIVANTVGKLLEGKSPDEVDQLSVVDPACGSGTFLLGAFQYLMDWHEAWYLNHEPEKWTKGKSPRMILTDKGELRLTTPEKKRILTNNLYGVDIDNQAVEVTKLSLLLKVLEEETGQLSLGFERVLPDLGENIKCGNSLIGWDYFKGQLLPDEKEFERVNPFDWKQAFPEVLRRGGFDAVIGNPPYIRIQSIREWAPNDVEHYRKIFASAQKGNFDIYVIFVEKGLSLLNQRGQLGFILPHKFFQAEFAKPLREILTAGKHIRKIVHFGAEQIFNEATTYTCLLFLSKTPFEIIDYVSINRLDKIFETLEAMDSHLPNEHYSQAMIQAPAFGPDEWEFSASKAKTVLDKIRRQTQTLGDVTKKIFQGIATSADKIYVLEKIEEKTDTILCFSKSLDRQVEIEKGILRPFLMGKDVHRYQPLEAKNYVIFPYEMSEKSSILMDPTQIRSDYPLGWAYLQENKPELSRREHGRYEGKQYYAFSRPQNMIEYKNQKILTPEISLGCNMSYDRAGSFYHTTKVYSFVFKKSQNEKPEYWLGILNSKLLWFFIKSTGYTLRGGYFTFKTNYLSPFPVATIDFRNPTVVKKHDQMVGLVEKMLALKRQIPMTPQEKDNLKHQTEATDSEINRLVYELYELTDEDIEIVESTSLT